MTDRERAMTLLAKVTPCAAEVHRAIVYIVDKNQNRPPQGEADGSFTDDQWTALRDISLALRSIVVNHSKLL